MPRNSKRIMFIANTRLKYTNILMSMYLSLIEMNYYVKEVDVLQHPGIAINPGNFQGGKGPVEINYDYLKHEIALFKPQMIVFGAGGLTFSEEVSNKLKQQGIILLGITLSDPDVFHTARNYAKRFSVHTTNSKLAYEWYKNLGFENTHYMPFAIDSRFFVPSEIRPEYKCDVAVIGHYQPSRLALTEELKKRFHTKIYGSRWPYENVKPVAYPEWLKAIHSSKIVVDFPLTRAGYQNVKIRLFEVAATETLLITQQLDEISEFFVYGRDIVGYSTQNELFDKIQYYLTHPEQRQQIAHSAQVKCAEHHMWKNRFSELFSKIGF